MTTTSTATMTATSSATINTIHHHETGVSSGLAGVTVTEAEDSSWLPVALCVTVVDDVNVGGAKQIARGRDEHAQCVLLDEQFCNKASRKKQTRAIKRVSPSSFPPACCEKQHEVRPNIGKIGCKRTTQTVPLSRATELCLSGNCGSNPCDDDMVRKINCRCGRTLTRT
jgi:hypothetical protein